ncbi:23S rRNA (pseudouridine(1915)-N(3))-methyltransferase RlmH [Marinivivus vitaminiproducens]|uniref:23S rRNA (pseudouridine(1915)-N(3))-methyltransferase RlmH n=1 Tax=Marinivivus vitaminiproducens TaxID=3035935 RepID=UPI0027A36F79|nr:23S rRNA (pseudouridine(1915)-N(3))-methyltransferase RlmH [Geminicoccaceae bacterium SCSIO 64248]
MRLTVIAAGRARSGPFADLVQDYASRLAWPFQVVEIVSKRPEGPERQADEAERLLRAVPDGAVTVALDGRGRNLPSAALAERLQGWIDEGRRDVAFLIGGADGLTEPVRRRADLLLAFGAQTWPHMLVRVMLVEQIYRATTILAGHPYHRA